MANRNKFINWYKSMIEQGSGSGNSLSGQENQSEIDELWTSLENKLDVNEVWTDLNHHFNRLDDFYRLEKFSIYTSIVALILAISFIYFSLGNDIENIAETDRQSQQQIDQLNQPERPKAVQKNVVPVSKDTVAETESNDVNKVVNGIDQGQDRKLTQYQSLKENNSKITNNADQVQTVEKPDLVSQQLIKDDESLVEANPESANINTDPMADIVVDLDENIMEDFRLLKKLPYQFQPGLSLHIPDIQGDSTITKYFKPLPAGFYGGITASYLNTWLLSPRTFTGLEKDEINQTKIDFGKEMGILAGYYFPNGLGVQMEILLFSDVGQKYNELINGKFIPTDISLTYNEINLTAKLRRKQIFMYPLQATHILYAGPFIAKLKEANERSLVYNSSSTKYKSTNIGAILGYDFELYPGKRFVISSGIRIKYGFTNIFRGDLQTPAFINRTRTASGGINISVKYFFSK